jgi:hypothetical protein
MDHTSESPDALGGAVEAKVEFEAAKLQGQEYSANSVEASAVDGTTAADRYRDAKWETAVMALESLNPQDAATICAAVLEEISAGDPPYDAFGDLRASAAWWVDFANVAEVEVYFEAALKRLGNQALGIRARKRLFVMLWQSFSGDDRRAFLARVDADGCFNNEVA